MELENLKNIILDLKDQLHTLKLENTNLKNLNLTAFEKLDQIENKTEKIIKKILDQNHE